MKEIQFSTSAFLFLTVYYISLFFQFTLVYYSVPICFTTLYQEVTFFYISYVRELKHRSGNIIKVINLDWKLCTFIMLYNNVKRPSKNYQYLVRVSFNGLYKFNHLGRGGRKGLTRGKIRVYRMTETI